MDFLNIGYLRDGNERQKLAYETLVARQIMEKLADFDPILTGTIPINIAIATSDLDIICYFENQQLFTEAVLKYFGTETDFQVRSGIASGEKIVVCNFKTQHFEIEIFGQSIPTIKQNAYLHMLVEHQILQSKDENFRLKIIQLKKDGYKTEPAFAILLGLKGNPYQSLLQLLPTVSH